MVEADEKPAGARDGGKKPAALERHLIAGGPGCGKTTRLVERAAELLAAGARPGGVRVFAATPIAAEAFAARLAERAGNEAARAVDVTTPRAFELELLGCAGAREATGREPRLMAPYEASMLMEDMKTSGLRPRRLKEMLRFFFRGWTELADDDPAWLVTDEEHTVHGLLKECLAFSRATLPSELPGLAVRALRAGVGDDEMRAAHVLVDDYQLLCRASQQLVGMVARKSLWVAGDEVACVEAFEPYPYAEGLDEFAQVEGTVVERLRESAHSIAVCGALEALACDLDRTCARERELRHEDRLARRAQREMRTLDEVRAELGDDAGQDGANRPAAADLCPRPAAGAKAGGAKWAAPTSPEGEVARIIEYVEEALDLGASATDIYVAVPNRAWRTMIRKAFDARHIPLAAPREAYGLGGDIRDPERCHSALAMARLAVAVDPTNDAAWRAVCGFGDWLANSPGFAAARRIANERGLRLHEVLALLAGDEGAGLLAACPADERASLGRILEARAATLVAIEPGNLNDDLALAAAALGEAPMPCDVDPAHVVDRLGVELAGVGFEGAEGVRVGTLEQVVGLSPTLLVVSGFVNGFYPPHAYFDEVETSPLRRAGMLAADERRLYAAVGSCTDSLLFTAFTEIDAVQAERLKVKVERIRMRNGVRTASVGVSVLNDVLYDR